MFFEKEMLTFNILDVVKLDQKNVNTFNYGRNFAALSFRFRADTFLKIRKNEYHIYDNFVSYIPSRLDYSRISSVDDMIVIHLEMTDYHTSDIEFFIPKDPRRLSELFNEIYECWSKKEIGYRYRCTALLYSIFAECYLQNFRSEPTVSKIKRSVEYILENFKDSSLSVKQAAERSFMSEVYFRKLFKTEFGVSPQRYIINLRIQNAIGLISMGCFNLKEIALMSGYNDYKYFSVEFKRIVGVSPSKYIYNYGEG